MKDIDVPNGCVLLSEFLLKGSSEIYVQRYHKDWCSLMPVVERIEKLGYLVNIGKNSCLISTPICKNSIKKYNKNTYSINSKIEAVFSSCIEFVKWVNQ